MLHEILLALAGHPSPLLEQNERASGLAISFSEEQLLAKIDTLSRLHRRLRQHLDTVVKRHQSVICRAVANSLLQIHLERFVSKILDVEASILRRDTSTVGAYDIVPLADVVSQFAHWQRRMAWFWDLAIFMSPVDQEVKQTACTGSALIDRLRADAQTGFPEIEEASVELSRVAELAWLKQLAAWLLYGDISFLGEDDFFLQREKDDLGNLSFRTRRELVPKFVSNATIGSILFIGRSLQQLLQSQTIDGSRMAKNSKLDMLVSTHSKLLSELTLPIVPVQLNHNIIAIRASLSRNVLRDLLPMRAVRISFQALRRFFLLSDGDFATCLINEAERRAEARWRNMDRLAQQDPIKALQGLSVKDAETSQVLRQTLKLITSMKQEDNEVEVVEFAKRHLSLNTARRAPSRPSTADNSADSRVKLSSVSFNDLLFASPTSLTLQIKPPFDLFLTAFDIGIYTHINAYLTAVRRAQLRLEDLWRRNTARRLSGSAHATQYTIALRKTWATCSAALLLLSEISAYLASDVMGPSYERFERWACEEYHDTSDVSTAEATQKDPETLAAGHRAFLDSLAYALLLADHGYTTNMRSLLGAIDRLIALFIRVLDIWHKDKPVKTLGNNTSTDLEDHEHKRLQHELDKACNKVDNDRRNIVTRLRDLHQLRIGSDRHYDVKGRDTGGFEPWRAGGLDHLLIKLEYGKMSDDLET